MSAKTETNKLTGLAAQVQGAKKELASLNEEVSRLRDERYAIESAPLPKRETIARLHKWVDSQAHVFMNKTRTSLRSYWAPQSRLDSNTVILLLDHEYGPIIPQSRFIGMFPDEFKRFITRAIESDEDYPIAGLPSDERPARLAELDTLIAKREEEIAQLEAALTGLNAEFGT